MSELTREQVAMTVTEFTSAHPCTPTCDHGLKAVLDTDAALRARVAELERENARLNTIEDSLGLAAIKLQDKLATMTAERDSWHADASSHLMALCEKQAEVNARTYTWTTARPTVAGWYWCRSADAISKWPDLSPVIVQVVVLPTTNALTILWAAQNQPVTHYNGTDEWAGPIQMPKEETHS